MKIKNFPCPTFNKQLIILTVHHGGGGAAVAGNGLAYHGRTHVVLSKASQFLGDN